MMSCFELPWELKINYNECELVGVWVELEYVRE